MPTRLHRTEGERVATRGSELELVVVSANIPSDVADSTLRGPDYVVPAIVD